jgi:hypothetical protein
MWSEEDHMTQPTPEPAPAPPSPEPGHGVIAHIEAWAAMHLSPELARIKADIGRVLEYGAAHEALAEQIVALVGRLAELADPAEAPAIASLVAGVERALAEVKRRAEEFSGTGM